MDVGRKKLSIIFSIIFICTASPVFAKKTFEDAGSALGNVVQKTGIEQEDVGIYLGDLIRNALTVAGIIFFVLTVYAGILWMTAGGEEDRVKKARKTLIASTIGMIILVGSYALTSFVQERIITNQSGEPSSVNSPSMIGKNASGQPTGCCYDWVKSNPESYPVNCFLKSEFIFNPTKTWRITTYEDCKYFGEAYRERVNDCWYGPEGQGVWQFFEGQEAADCLANL